MEWEFIAPMIVMVVAILTIGGVAILRPLSKRLSELLELYARDKSSGQTAELRRVRETLESLESRLRLVEERQDFTDKLLKGTAEGRAEDARSRRERVAATRDPERLPRPDADSEAGA